MAVNLSELSPDTAKEAVELLSLHGFLERSEEARLKNFLNIVFLHDSKVLLFPEIELREEPLLQEFGNKPEKSKENKR